MPQEPGSPCGLIQFTVHHPEMDFSEILILVSIDPHSIPIPIDDLGCHLFILVEVVAQCKSNQLIKKISMIRRPNHKNILTFQSIAPLSIAKMEIPSFFFLESYKMALIKTKVLYQTGNNSFVVVYTGSAH